MKRSVVFASCLSVVISACSQVSDVQILSPEEVLKNAAQVSMDLETVRYDLSGDVHIVDANDVPTNGTMTMKGLIRDSGEQLQFSVDFSATTKYPEGDSSLSATVDVIIAGSEDLFVRLERYDLDGTNPFFNPELLDKFTGTWWKVPSRDNQVSSVSLTPNPRILHAQSQVISVLKDKGLATLQGRKMYHYDVRLDQDKMVTYLQQLAGEAQGEFDEAAVRASLADLEAKGEIWIDAETFAVQKLHWDIRQKLTNTNQQIQTSFTVNFSDHNNAPAIVPPTDAKDFSPLMFFGVTDIPETQSSPLTPEMQDDIIRQLLEEGADSPYTTR
ncbi:hypothetical protein COU78_05375 [Candidatus Peregrinibacteria bacterium CG10_big_fil_rev_8_21_14_0_10_49_24]|nr:MAG: hypothetical protein COV83_01745 [Candidatus Peregrinibacteria bacterium CG11_big_fil_rev_8_21_14_0_20_49_14]PIR50775.1 MAG: hypothetical protein COU78_05375 [Candidatus Peregrinibacteria bacterium CG10_big_fil_rev_8_21_14_0_10_49_24]PJA68180.1 MAG: hypothetical protein CO157_00435 [Candidatus Peregrinibacteria bacterium CG_4_9_14_3_um_filter_49_12]